MGLKTWAIATGMTQAFKFVDEGGKIEQLAMDVDIALDKSLGKRSEGVQAKFVEHVLLPLAYHLMIDERPFKLQKLLIDMNEGISKTKGGKS